MLGNQKENFTTGQGWCLSLIHISSAVSVHRPGGNAGRSAAAAAAGDVYKRQVCTVSTVRAVCSGYCRSDTIHFFQKDFLGVCAAFLMIDEKTGGKTILGAAFRVMIDVRDRRVAV